ncbi:MAG: 6,7-dimethyl-8-ribityllumazine synthase [Chloroflexi bacterium]|nr:6,7-dimethyl-8-ribityllumazine synthase [Chloroflexota bacterium]
MVLRQIEGSLHGQGLRIGVVVSRFNQVVTSRLLDGAMEGLLQHGVREHDIIVAWVPGSFEIPLVAKKMAESNRYEAIICLGAVIKGETAHFDYVAGEASNGIAKAALEVGVPIIFGVLTTYTTEQALDRAGGEQGNKGFEAAESAIEMATLMRLLGGSEEPLA